MRGNGTLIPIHQESLPESPRKSEATLPIPEEPQQAEASAPELQIAPFLVSDLSITTDGGVTKQRKRHASEIFLKKSRRQVPLCFP